jgi:hypothetical protein
VCWDPNTILENKGLNHQPSANDIPLFYWPCLPRSGYCRFIIEHSNLRDLKVLTLKVILFLEKI